MYIARMSRGLGRLQQAVKGSIQEAERYGVFAVTFADIRNATVIRHGGRLRPTFERSLKRAVKTLKDRGDLVIIQGDGGRGSPYRYATRETVTLLGGLMMVPSRAASRLRASAFSSR
jgi:hypothetical protein